MQGVAPSEPPRSATVVPSDSRALQPLRLLWPLLILAMIFWASSRSRVAGPGLTQLDDKIGHFAAYGLLATLVCRAGRGWQWALIGWTVASAFGASDEWHQSFVPGRRAEFADWVADAAGAALAVTLYLWCGPYRRLLEAPLWGRMKA